MKALHVSGDHLRRRAIVDPRPVRCQFELRQPSAVDLVGLCQGLCHAGCVFELVVQPGHLFFEMRGFGMEGGEVVRELDLAVLEVASWGGDVEVLVIANVTFLRGRSIFRGQSRRRGGGGVAGGPP
jgi:hypothetical protein